VLNDRRVIAAATLKNSVHFSLDGENTYFLDPTLAKGYMLARVSIEHGKIRYIRQTALPDRPALIFGDRAVMSNGQIIHLSGRRYALFGSWQVWHLALPQRHVAFSRLDANELCVMDTQTGLTWRVRPHRKVSAITSLCAYTPSSQPA